MKRDDGDERLVRCSLDISRVLFVGRIDLADRNAGAVGSA